MIIRILILLWILTNPLRLQPARRLVASRQTAVTRHFHRNIVDRRYHLRLSVVHVGLGSIAVEDGLLPIVAVATSISTRVVSAGSSIPCLNHTRIIGASLLSLRLSISPLFVLK